MDYNFAPGTTAIQMASTQRLERHRRNSYLLAGAIVLLVFQSVLPAYLFSRFMTVLILGFIGYRSFSQLFNSPTIEKFPTDSFPRMEGSTSNSALSDERLSPPPEHGPIEDLVKKDDEHRLNALHPAIRMRADLDVTRWQVPMGFHQENQKAQLLQGQGRIEESKVAFETAVQMIQGYVPETHPAVLITSQQIYRCIMMLGKPEESLPLFEKGVQAAKESFGGAHSWIIMTLMDLAQCHRVLWQLDDAASCAKEALKIARDLDEQAGRREMFIAQIEIPVIELLFIAGNFAESLQVARDCQIGSRALRDDNAADLDSLIASLHEATALVFLNKGTQASDLVNQALIALQELKIDPGSPPGTLISGMIRNIYIDMLNYGPVEETFAINEERVIQALNTATSEATVREAVEIMVSGALSKAYTRKFQDASRILKFLVPKIDVFDKGPRVQHLLTTLLLGNILCCQYRFLEADELVYACCNRLSDYFGYQSPEHVQSLILYGFIQLHRGKFEMSIATLRVASQGLEQKDVFEIRATCLPLVRLYTAFGCLCLGRFPDAKTLLNMIREEETRNGGVPLAVSRLTTRCLGNIFALNGDFTQASHYFKSSLKPSENPELKDDSQKEQDLVGDTMCRWSLAWALYELGSVEEAGKMLVNVKSTLQSKFGNDHKLTMASTHDLFWVNRCKLQAADEFSKLHKRTLELLGEGHSLTRRIAQSMALCPVAGKQTPTEPKRIWTLGESSDRPMQISDVDWLTWIWDIEDRNVPFIPKRLLRTGSNLQDVFPHKLKDPGTPPRFPKKLDPRTFRQMSTFITKLLLEFPRDFSPAFVEAIYSSRKEVPYIEQRRLGRAILEVRDSTLR